MNKLLIAAVAVGAIAAFNLAPQFAQARDCSKVTATARGVTQGIATERADRRLNRYVTSSLSGWRVRAGPRHSCQGWGAEGLRPACNSAAVVCS
jgi:hypothetical protein